MSYPFYFLTIIVNFFIKRNILKGNWDIKRLNIKFITSSNLVLIILIFLLLFFFKIYISLVLISNLKFQRK